MQWYVFYSYWVELHFFFFHCNIRLHNRLLVGSQHHVVSPFHDSSERYPHRRDRARLCQGSLAQAGGWRDRRQNGRHPFVLCDCPSPLQPAGFPLLWKGHGRLTRGEAPQGHGAHPERPGEKKKFASRQSTNKVCTVLSHTLYASVEYSTIPIIRPE